jgi:hypothetical protein
MFLHKEEAEARAADSTINTELESCMKALMKTEKEGLTFVLTMKILSPANLGEQLELGAVVAST